MASLERVTNLLALLLETKLPLTLQEIAQALGQYPDGPAAQRAAFERDKAVLRDVGVPISTEVLTGDERAGATGYRIDRRRYELADLKLTDDERRALQIAVAAVRTDARWAREGLWKLGGHREDEPVAVAASVPVSPVLAALHQANVDRRAVQFGYRDRVRTVDPYSLMLRDGFWYLIGHDHDRGEMRSFRVDRIDLERPVTAIADRRFDVPADFDPRRVMPDDPKLIGDAHAERRRSVVRVWPPRAAAVVRELGAEAVVDRLADGAIDVEVPFVNSAALRSWVLGLGSDAEVLEPDDVRADTIAWLSAIAAQR